MRKSLTFTATGLSLAAALLLSGCTPSESTPAPASSSAAPGSSAPSAPVASAPPSQAPVETTSPKADADAVADLYANVFNGIYHVSDTTKDELASLNDKYDSLDPADYNAQMTDLVPALARIDGESATTKAAYVHALLGVTLPILQQDTTGAFKDLEYSVNKADIELSSDQTKASLPLSAVRGTYKGKTQAGEGSSRTYAVKKGGSWLIDPTRG